MSYTHAAYAASATPAPAAQLLQLSNAVPAAAAGVTAACCRSTPLVPELRLHAACHAYLSKRLNSPPLRLSDLLQGSFGSM